MTSGEIELAARHDGPNHRDQRTRRTWRQLLVTDDDHEHGNRQPGGRNIRLVHALNHGHHLHDRAMALLREPDQPGELARRDLHAHAGQKADQCAARKKICQKAQPENARDDEHHSHRHGDRAGEADVFTAAQRRDRREGARKDGCCRGVGRDHQLTRRTKDRKRDQWQQNRIEAAYGGRTGNLRVPPDLRNAEGRQRNPGDDVMWQLPGI